MSFTRMNQGKIEDRMSIGQAITERQSRMPQMIKAMPLEDQVENHPAIAAEILKPYIAEP